MAKHMDKRSDHPIQLSIISTCKSQQIRLLFNAWQAIKQNGIESELIWLGQSDDEQLQMYPDLRIVRLSHRSNRNGCWQAGLHMARSSQLLLISRFTPTLSRRTCDKIARLLAHPQSSGSKLAHPRQWLAGLAVLHGHYQLAMQLLPMCLIDYDALIDARNHMPKHWYQRFNGYDLSSV